MKVRIFLLFLFLWSCNDESFLTVGKGKVVLTKNTYQLGISDKSRLIMMDSTPGHEAAYYIENNKIDTTRLISHFDKALMAESYQFVNFSQKGDRYFFLDADGDLFYSKDSISSTKIFDRPIFNQSLTNFIFPRGIFFNENLTVPGHGSNRMGDGLYFNGDSEEVEKITDRLLLVDGSMPIDSSDYSLNFTSDHCDSSPSSCVDTPYTWVTRVIFPDSENSVVGIASRMVVINSVARAIPTYVFRMTHTSIEKKLITGLTIDQMAEVEQIQFVGLSGKRFYRTVDEFIWSYNPSSSTIVNTTTNFYGINKKDLTLSVRGSFTGMKSGFVIAPQYMDEDLSSSYVHPIYRHSAGGVWSFHFYFNHQWLNSTALDAVVNAINPQFITFRKHANGWIFSTRSSMGLKSLIWCDEDLSTCSEFANTININNQHAFLDDSFAYIMTETELRKYDKGQHIQTHVFDDLVVGKEYLNLFTYRQGSLIAIRYDSDILHGYIYQFDRNLKIKEKIHHGNISSNAWGNAEEERFIVAVQKTLNIWGSWFILRD